MADNQAFRAGFGARLAAYVIDRLILLVPVLLLRGISGLVRLFSLDFSAAKSVFFDYSAMDVFCYLLVAAYFVTLTYFTGSTLGKKVLRLRVTDENGEALTFINVLYRETIGRFLSGILFAGYLMALVDRSHRTFHDWLCDSCVVYAEGTFRPGQRTDPEDEAPSALPAYGYSVPGIETEQSEAEHEE